MSNEEFYKIFYASPHITDELLYPLSFVMVNSNLFPVFFSMYDDNDNYRTRLLFLGYEQRNAYMMKNLILFDRYNSKIIHIILDK